MAILTGFPPSNTISCITYGPKAWYEGKEASKFLKGVVGFVLGPYPEHWDKVRQCYEVAEKAFAEVTTLEANGVTTLNIGDSRSYYVDNYLVKSVADFLGIELSQAVYDLDSPLKELKIKEERSAN